MEDFNQGPENGVGSGSSEGKGEDTSGDKDGKTSVRNAYVSFPGEEGELAWLEKLYIRKS